MMGEVNVHDDACVPVHMVDRGVQWDTDFRFVSIFLQ